ncbi:hypothetical protein Btru_035526 [Bulinus truncatus]|nr:hypothetical protein Btru_035526 [Bulinus truncatus]
MCGPQYSRPVDMFVPMFHYTITLLIILSITFHDVTATNNENKKVIYKRREKRTVNQATHNNSQLTEMLNQYSEMNHSDLLQYTPRTPDPENINCYVEVPVTQRVGGRCIPLGNHMGCQAGMYLAFSSECQPEGAVTTDDSSSRRRTPSRRRHNPVPPPRVTRRRP